MRNREAPIVLGGVYRLPSSHVVRIEAALAGGELACRYAADALTLREHLFSRQPRGEVSLTERFIAKHAKGPRR